MQSNYDYRSNPLPLETLEVMHSIYSFTNKPFENSSERVKIFAIFFFSSLTFGVAVGVVASYLGIVILTTAMLGLLATAIAFTTLKIIECCKNRSYQRRNFPLHIELKRNNEVFLQDHVQKLCVLQKQLKEQNPIIVNGTEVFPQIEKIRKEIEVLQKDNTSDKNSGDIRYLENIVSDITTLRTRIEYERDRIAKLTPFLIQDRHELGLPSLLSVLNTLRLQNRQLAVAAN